MKILEAGVNDVLLATDFSESAQRAFDAAIRIARVFDARLHILHVNEEEAVFSGHGSDELNHFLVDITRRRADWMTEYQESATELGIQAEAITRDGLASDAIMAVAEELDAGVIVMGTTGARGLTRFLHGMTAQKVLRHSHRPVLTVSPHAKVTAPGEGGSFEHLLYPTDFSPASHAGLAIASILTSLSQARLTLVHVLRLPTTVPSLPGEPAFMIPVRGVEGLKARFEAQMEELAESLENENVVDTCVEAHTDAAEGIADVAEREDIDLIAIPRHSKHTVTSTLFGRTAENLCKIAPVPVLLFTPRA